MIVDIVVQMILITITIKPKMHIKNSSNFLTFKDEVLRNIKMAGFYD